MVKVLSFSFEQCFGLFTMFLWKGALKWVFLDIYLTTFFAARNFQNTSAVRVIFFLKICKIEFQTIKKKIHKIFFVSEIIASKNVAIDCLY